MPCAAIAGVRRRIHGSWAAVGFGALGFLVAEPLLRLPLHVPLEVWVQGHASGLPLREGAWLLASGLTAGLFQETARWAVFRWALRGQRSWNVGVLAGLGHGVAASVLLVGLPAAASLVAYVLLTQGLTLGLPPQALAQLAAQYQGLSFGTAALAGVEPLLAIPVHVALSLLVLKGFIRAQRRWLWGAVGLHAVWAAVLALAQRDLGPGAAAVLSLGLAVAADVLVSRAQDTAAATR